MRESVKTTYISELRTEATHVQSGNKLISDAPLDNKGKGEAFSPTDLLATSLGSCMLTVMGIAAREHGFNIDGTRVKIWKIMESDPRRVGEIKIELTFPKKNYSEKEKKFIKKAAHTCPVNLSLHPGLKKQSYLITKMEIKIPTGIKHHEEIIVTNDHSAKTFGSGSINVFATPAMIALLEKTAHNSVQPLLPDGFTTVGTEVNIKHLKATPIGKQVRSDSYLKSVDGKKLLFELHAWDEKGLIGIGTHTRVIIEEKGFMEKLK